MSTTRILLQSLRYYWRTNLGIVLGTALGAMVLVGALMVGDSVKATLVRQAEERIGKATSAMIGGEHFFRAKLGDEVGAAPVLMLRGSVSTADGSARANQVQIVGVTPAFWLLGDKIGAEHLFANSAFVSPRLAQQLGVSNGSNLIIRLDKPSRFSKDAPLSGSESEIVSIRAPVGGTMPAQGFGNFSLQANQVPPLTIFLPLDFLAERLGVPKRANLLLAANKSPAQLREAVQQHRSLVDTELEIRGLVPNVGSYELRTSRVFLEPPIVEAAPAGQRSLTYLVNELRAGDKAAPYSMVTAVDLAATPFLPKNLGDDQIAISQWLADDLGLAEGGKITLKYFVMGERRALTEASRDFTVAAILPMETPGLDSSWMPDFPGLSDRKNCRDWEPGFAMDTGKIRPKDEEYWQKFRGTPKAFVSFAAGKEMWGNRWGNVTALRYGANVNSEEIWSQLLSRLQLENAGMNFVPLREQALAATNVPVPFGELFLSFSFFLLIAAGMLTGLLFVFHLEQRGEEAGLLLGVGWPAKRVRRLLLGEGLALAVIGSVIGAAGGLAYTWGVLRALDTVWRGAIGQVEIAFSARPATIIGGILGSIFVALLSMWLASRRQLRRDAHTLLTSGGAGDELATIKSGRGWTSYAAIACLVCGLGALIFAGKAGPMAFFSAGFLLLLAGIFGSLSWLRRAAMRASGLGSLNALGARNAARRRGRSATTIAVLASGVFMVISVDAFRQKGLPDSTARHSGTGGFALLAESATPLYEDLNSSTARDGYGIPKLPDGTHFVPMRVRDGDDASCLNLNRALQPRILGVKPTDLAALGAFPFGGRWKGSANGVEGWDLLDTKSASDEAIPAVADSNTLEWALQKGLGDRLTFLDERGRPFEVRLIASVTGTILQGSLLISENDFIAKYPNAAGYRYFLIDTPTEQASEVRGELSRALGDRGFEVIATQDRLAALQTVENTYLAIFQALGGLGLLLGSAGLAIVVARNVLERRREFGLLEAVGFQPGQLRSLVFAEHRWLILAGLAIGIGSAIIAVWPSLGELARGFPLKEMLMLIGALVVGSLFWAWLATRLSLRGEHISALRDE